MTTKKNGSEPSKKNSASKVAKAADQKKCDCKDCKCECSARCLSQIPLYVLIGILVATMTILVISICFNRSVRDLFKPSNYVYSGRFDSESKGDERDSNDIAILSAGAAVDMVSGSHDGILLICSNGHLACDTISGWLAPYVDSMGGKIYRYNMPDEENADYKRAYEALGLIDSNIPDVVYIKDGYVYDRIDNPRSNANLYDFVYKYLPKDDNEEDDESEDEQQDAHEEAGEEENIVDDYAE